MPSTSNRKGAPLLLVKVFVPEPIVIAVPELLHVHTDSLHVQVEKSTLKLLASSQHVEETLITGKELKWFSYKVKAVLEQFWCLIKKVPNGQKHSLIYSFMQIL